MHRRCWLCPAASDGVGAPCLPSVRGVAGDPGLVRRRPLDGKTPLDFLAADGTWPQGPFASPWSPQELRRLGLDAHQADAYVRSVASLGRLVWQYRRWRAGRDLTQDAVARRLGVSQGRLSALNQGHRFPNWDLVELLRDAMGPGAQGQQARR